MPPPKNNAEDEKCEHAHSDLRSCLISIKKPRVVR